MKTIQQKIDAIYEKIARKDLSFGCEIKKGNTFLKIVGSEVGGNFIIIGPGFRKYVADIDDVTKSEIIGHPVMIGDVIDYFEKIGEEELGELFVTFRIRWDEIPYRENILSYWKNKRLPIEEQSDECIDFIYNLITN